MSPAEAAKLLELPADAAPDQIEARFNELRTKLEEKIGKAPTPGLKAKYRETLDEITRAFETLTLAADSSALPVLNKQSAVSDQRSAQPGSGATAATPPGGSDSGLQSPVYGLPPTKRAKSGGREFAIVAVIAVAVLGAGGWWIVKTRAEKAEQARIAAEAKAEAERKAAAEKTEAERRAAEEKRLAEERRLAEEAEKARLAAVAKAEADRLEKLTATLLAELAESKVTWEAFETEQRNADRRLGDLKSDLRNAPSNKRAYTVALAAAQEDYHDWLSETLPRHPAKIALVRAEQLLSARQIDNAREAMAEVKSALTHLEKQIVDARRERLSITGSLSLDSTPPGLDWTLTDAFGARWTGRTPAELTDVGIGSAEIVFRRAGWTDQRQTVQIVRNRLVMTTAEFVPGYIEITSTPSGAEVWANGTRVGMTPFKLTAAPGHHNFQLKLEKYEDATVSLIVVERQTARADAPMAKKKPSFVMGDRPNPAWSAQIASTEFKATLMKALGSGQSLSVTLPGMEDEVFLEVSLDGFDGPENGATMTARANTHWVLRYSRDRAELWSQIISGTHTAGLGDAFVGTTRAQLVKRVALEAAVNAGLATISRLKSE